MSHFDPPLSKQRQAEIAGALAALKRARIRAEEIAAATGTSLIFWQDGRTVRVEPRPSSNDEPDEQA